MTSQPSAGKEMTTLMFLAGFKPTIIGVISYCGLGYDTM
jgi:hypothetical protein